MIVVMEPEATREQIEHVIERVGSVGLKAILLEGTNRNVIAATGDRRRVDVDFWHACPMMTTLNVVQSMAPAEWNRPVVLSLIQTKETGQALWLDLGRTMPMARRR